MKIKYAFSLLLIMLTGCTTWSVNYLDSTPVVEEKLDPAFSKYQSPTDETARIIVVRDDGLGGLAFRTNFFINGERVAKIHIGQSVTLHMKPEEYQLGINLQNHPSKEWPLTVMEGETYVYRIRASTSILTEGMVLERTL